MWLKIISLSILVCHLSLQAQATGVLEAVRDCVVTQKFGRTYWLCDPANILSEVERDEIRGKLTDMQVTPSCPCEESSQCRRKVYIDDPEGEYTAVVQHSFTGALVIVDEWDTDTIEEDVQTVYDDNSMGFEQCENGVLTVYNSAENLFYTYTGEHAEERLTKTEMQVLQDRARSRFEFGEHSLRIGYLLDNVNEELRHEPIDLYALSAFIGMALGASIAIAAIVLILIICCSTFCCKPKKKAPKSIYSAYGPSNSTMKGQQPYMIMPPSSPTGDNTTTRRSSHDSEISVGSASTGHSAYNMPVPPFVDPTRPRSASSRHMDLY